MKSQSVSHPLVSICMPVFNGEQWIGAAIESALAQTRQDFEFVISDNNSTDSTLKIAESYIDPRIKIFRSPENAGIVANHNRVIRLSKGKYIKFLHADDLLLPSCIETMVEVAEEDERIGLVFGPREVLIYDDDESEWAQICTRYHERFGRLERSNDGRALFFQQFLAGFDENWIGEPSAILLRRSCLQESGLFNPQLRVFLDMELSLRVMLTHRIGFVDKPLTIRRQHGKSEMATSWRADRLWLDRLWMLEGLLHAEGIGPIHGNVFYLRRKELRHVLWEQVRRIAKGHFSLELPAYLRYRSLPASRQVMSLREPLDAPESQ